MEGPDHRPRAEHAVLLPRVLRQRAARPAGHRRESGLHDARSRPGRARRSSSRSSATGARSLAAGNPDQANVISQIAASGSRFAVTTGDNAYETGSQKDYGDLYQIGDNTSAVFGPNFWKVAGASLPLFPAIGNHDYNNSMHAHELAAGHGGLHLRRALPDRHVLLHRTAPPRRTTRARLVRVRRRAGALLRAEHGVGRHERRHGRPRSRTTSTTTGGRTRRSTSGSRTTSRPTRERCGSRSSTTRSTPTAATSGPNTFLQGANSLEGLLKLYDVTADFNGAFPQLPAQHAHRPAASRRTSPAVAARTSSRSAPPPAAAATTPYGIGWSNTSNVGSACGAAPRARHEGPRAPLPARERERHVGDGHAHRRARAGRSTRSPTTRRRRTPTCR